MFDDFLLSISILTRFPTKNIKNINYKRASIYFVIVGYLAALLLFISYLILSKFFGIDVVAIIVLLEYYYLFGFFHFDGFLDVCDGFGAPHVTKIKRFKIMSDPNVGSFALLYGVLFLLFQYIIFVKFSFGWMLMTVFSRFAIVFLLTISKPAKENGLGALYFPFKKKYCIVALILLLPIIIISLKIFIIGVFSAILIAFILKLISKYKINGITGDVIGATVILCELLYLLMIIKF